MISCILAASAQKNQKQNEPNTGYVITAAEKGGRNWKEVKLVNVTTGEELKSIYQSTQETEALNARTQKPVAKKTIPANTYTATYKIVEPTPGKRTVNLDEELNKAQSNGNTGAGNMVRSSVSATTGRTVTIIGRPLQMDKPFAGNSAAIAYDKKHDRLYYTPMSFNQLRYIDLKSGKIYFFEDEPFGQVKGFGDVANQITRMSFASDGNGYALSNDANHLIRFTTGKNPTVTDLGALTDDGKNEKTSVHSQSGFGGNMVADANGNLYLVTANRSVFKFSITDKVATWLGAIKGLPRGYSTNGAMVEGGSKVIVASSESTEGYYRFDLNTLQAEKASGEGQVFNASDLANGNLAFDKKSKDRENTEQPPVLQDTKTAIAGKELPQDITGKSGISVYPNPVTDGYVRISFADQPIGKYQVQFMDLSGKLISTQEVVVSNKLQVTGLNLPRVAQGEYLIRITGEGSKVSATNKIVVQYI
jgi:hypothetical protein